MVQRAGRAGVHDGKRDGRFSVRLCRFTCAIAESDVRPTKVLGASLPNVAVNRRAAFQVRRSRSGALLAANELPAASGEVQAA
jgi:hypothetical protein